MANLAKYQIFISSTFDDLQEERDQVIRAVLEMGHIPVGMEMFSAADDQQWQIIARHIEESDYYAVIVAHRYGSLTETGVSYTQKEYEHAVGKGIPVLGFVIDDKAPWPADRIDAQSGSNRTLEAFKDVVRSKPVSFWTNADDLYGRFSVALMKAFTANPREGWIRASSAEGGPGVTAEVVRLSSENAALRQELADMKAAAGKEQTDEIDKVLYQLSDVKRTPSYRYTPGGAWQTDTTVTLYQVFAVLSQQMIIEAEVGSMAKNLAMEIRVDRKKDWDIVATNQVRDYLADFVAVGLVQPSSRKHAVSDSGEYWSLTDFGNDALKLIRKLNLARSVEKESPLESGQAAEASQADGGDTEGDSA